MWRVAWRESALPAARSVDWLEIREYLVLKHDGNSVRFPVRDGDVGQAQLRAALVRRPEDSVVAVTADAYIQVRPDATGAPPDTRPG